MKLQQVIEHLSVGETLDIKELILTVIDNPDLENIYEQIKDTK
ncbi:hypothetical protein ACQKM1_22600 [Peribacillus frigoritolerans]